MRSIRAALAALLCLFALPAFAGPCIDWKEALTIAKQKFGQVPAFIASMPNSVLIITVNPKTGSWTAFAQPNPDVMCPVAGGEGWGVAPDSVRKPIEDLPDVIPQMFRGKNGIILLPA